MNQNQLAPIKRNLKTALEKPSFQEMLRMLDANGIPPEVIAQKAYFAISKNDRLLTCTTDSLLTSVGASAIVGIDCTGSLGQGYLVPFGKECVFVVGYQGLIDLARRSGHVNRVEARVVYENETFEVLYGSDQFIKHIPTISGDRGKPICAYAIAELKGGSKQFELMRIDEINSIRDRSPSKGQGPWTTDYSEMCRKTVVRRIVKYLPKTPDLAKALSYEDGDFDFKVKEVESEVTDTKPVVDRLKEQLGAEPEPEPAPKKKKGKKGKKSSPQEVAEPSAQTATATEESVDGEGGDTPSSHSYASPPPATPTEDGKKAITKCTRCGKQYSFAPNADQCPECLGTVVLL